jgi:hypothetical protein
VKDFKLDIDSLRVEVVADFIATIACEELDELKSEVSLSKFCEALASPMIFLTQ